ncbi:MAG: uracil phosphoribosyltransferase [cyanobacterium endosymbiont of Rhopalodia musculus]|uniref:uracil phosphoribosyltransferase n=1 Tax=cyanobacterium endosymbiont of Epithemia clementina EcSB TaxID=3034674 RepID=UPI00247FB853|nr:uracil phosphoribosyltransferase [cyanobacterium endosymbiont of Epithemia clementina EcSB]WGT67215.1 uracil phosphoribosyltransferase [cyanobacterium endosymbiont of Epithemia clementina EcSB]
MTFQLRVYVPDHPLIKHWLGVARDANTPNILFKTAMTELGRWLTYEATRHWLPTLETTIKTPITNSQATLIDPQVPLAVVPLLRAGLALLDGAQTLLPLASIYHLGLAHNEEILDVSCYLNKLPQQFHPKTQIIVLEPMLATGRSITVAMDEITKRGANPELMRIISVVAAPPALQKLSKKYPSLNIYTAIIDEGINDRGYIVPGLGDAGNRAFGT